MPADKQKVNYQPQVPSTINGPLVHRFIPPGCHSCSSHAPGNCVACTPNNRLGIHRNPMSYSSAHANCGCNVSVNVRCHAHAGSEAVAGMQPIIWGPIGYPGGGFSGQMGGFPGGIMQQGHRGGGNIIINNGPTAAGGHILQGAGTGGMGVGFPGNFSGFPGQLGGLEGSLIQGPDGTHHHHHHHGHGHVHTYPGGARFLQAPGGIMMGGGPMMLTGGGCAAGGSGPIWNGQQWVTHGQTGAQHLLNMKAKTDRKPQELAPADGDISRMYEVQELDGNWTRRNRFTIDSGEIGKIRWFQRPDGSFFAKRLPTG